MVYSNELSTKETHIMVLQPAICTQCGGQIEVDSTKEAGNCIHCQTAFITEKVINNFIHNTTHNTQNIDQRVIVKNIIGKEMNEAEDFIKNGEMFLNLEEWDKAETQFQQAVGSAPANWRGWFGLAKANTHNFTICHTSDNYNYQHALNIKRMSFSGMYDPYSSAAHVAICQQDNVKYSREVKEYEELMGRFPKYIAKAFAVADEQGKREMRNVLNQSGYAKKYIESADEPYRKQFCDLVETQEEKNMRLAEEERIAQIKKQKELEEQKKAEAKEKAEKAEQQALAAKYAIEARERRKKKNICKAVLTFGIIFLSASLIGTIVSTIIIGGGGGFFGGIFIFISYTWGNGFFATGGCIGSGFMMGMAGIRSEVYLMEASLQFIIYNVLFYIGLIKTIIAGRLLNS